MSADYITFQMTGGLDWDQPYMSFIHILLGATVTSVGDVFVHDVKIVAPTCSKDLGSKPPHVSRHPIYNEVFVISQYWGDGHYHNMMEDLPRLTPFLHFLRKNPNVSIHVMTQSKMMMVLFRALGLDPKRMVSGNIAGHLVYLPRSTACGHLLISEGQLLSREYRIYIQNSLTGDKLWNSVVFIKRIRNRYFVKQREMEETVSSLAAKYGLRYELFAEKPLPSPEDTMSIFYRARVIVGPHGAGLSNMLFSRPGPVIIEGTCDKPNINTCYLIAAYHLGHRYHGIPSRGGCNGGIAVEPADMGTVLEYYLADL